MIRSYASDFVYDYFIVYKATPFSNCKYLSFPSTDYDYSDTMHIWDVGLNTIIPAIKFLLQMPHTNLDLYKINSETFSFMKDETANYVFISSNVVEECIEKGRNLNPKLILYANECKHDAEKLLKKFKPILGICCVEDLSNSQLCLYWNTLLDNEDDCNLTHLEKKNRFNEQLLLSGELLQALPFLSVMQSFYRLNDLLKDLYQTPDKYSKCLEYFNSSFVKDKNIVITFPGISQRQVKYFKLNAILPDEEATVIKYIGVHEALSKNALYIELPCANSILFKILNDLEVACQNNTNNKYVWRSLKQIGKMVSTLLGNAKLGEIKNANHLSVFSNFPIGLSIFDGDSDSLCLYTPISYNPLTPLTQRLSLEMRKQYAYSFYNKLTVAFAECILPSDSIRSYADIFSSTLIELKNNYDNFSVNYKETLTIRHLSDFINENSNADILIISAHGNYVDKSNQAVIMVGDEPWICNSPQLNFPPVVFLSACHVSPRGTGSMSIADMFLNYGAHAVLGTLIPVDVQRNANLLIKIVELILLSQNGKCPCKTLSEVFQYTLSTNALLEMMADCKKLENWMLNTAELKQSRICDFEKRWNNRKDKTKGQVYKQTIEIVKCMLQEEDADGQFANILNDYDFFPESFFYQLLGHPENVFLGNRSYLHHYSKV